MKRPGVTKRLSRRPLVGRLALVAGATRGAGRGIARALGEAGATVYCTGRSVHGKPEYIRTSCKLQRDWLANVSRHTRNLLKQLPAS